MDFQKICKKRILSSISTILIFGFVLAFPFSSVFGEDSDSEEKVLIQSGSSGSVSSGIDATTGLSGSTTDSDGITTYRRMSARRKFLSLQRTTDNTLANRVESENKGGEGLSCFDKDEGPCSPESGVGSAAGCCGVLVCTFDTGSLVCKDA